MQDSFDVFPTPVDSVRVAAQDITSTAVTKALDFWESLLALINLINIEYIVLVCLSYYILVNRVQFIKLNSVARRNLAIFALTIIWGVFGYFLREIPWLNLLVTGLGVNAAWEYIFKGIFGLLEKRFGWKLQGWRVDEIKEEKAADIIKAESIRKDAA